MHVGATTDDALYVFKRALDHILCFFPKPYYTSFSSPHPPPKK